MHTILLWALVALIGRVHCKCSLVPIVDDERLHAYACTHGDLNDLDEISSDANWIEFTVSRFHLIPDNAFWRFKNLQRLSFYNCHVNFIAPDAFTGLNELQWLIFHGTKIHAVKTSWFRSLTNLRKLVLDRCSLVHIEPDVFRLLPRVETLDLRDNDLDCLPIEELRYLRSLKVVRIDGNPWLCECRQALDKYFQSQRIVQEIECTRQITVCRKYQCMTPIHFPVHSSSLQATHLDGERTIIRGNEFQTNVFTSLDRLPDKTTWILVSGLRIEKLPRYAFFRFGNSLRSLDLTDCRISVIEDEAFAGLHKLERLSLVGNQFPILGSTWFRNLVSLQQLILQRNYIKQIERTALWQVAETLRYLDVRNNLLRCIAIEELAELKKLERLDVTGNPWLCICQKNLENFLTQRNVAFEINVNRCYKDENEISDGSTDWRRQQTINTTSLTTGKVHWTSFEDTIKQSNITIIRDPPPIPQPEIHVVTPQTPVYEGSCYPERRDGSIYVCKAITSVEELSVIPPHVQSIKVSLSNIKRIPQNTFTRFNGYLTKLELEDCGIEIIEPRTFTKLYNLQYLSLRSNQLESINAETLHGVYNLKHLDISRNNIYRITNDVFDNLPYLTHLDVSDNSMNCIGVEYMEQRLHYLTSLDVSNNPWSCLCGTKLAEYLDSKNIRYDKNSLLLREDCYASTKMETTIVPTFPITPSTPNETIEGTCTSYQDNAEIRYRCSGGNLYLLQSIPTNATAIEFHGGHLPRLPSDVFARFVNLREIIIRNCGLNVVEQGAFNNLHNLQNLTIQDNPLETIESSWFILENLERLDLRGNSINHIEPGSFRNLTKLTYLNLEGNDLKCIFTSDLNDMPLVYIVEFSGNPLKWRCRIELEQFLEARKIRFVKIENSCEGKKIMRNLLLQNKTDGSFDCPSDCSAATDIVSHFLIIFILPLLVTLIY